MRKLMVVAVLGAIALAPVSANAQSFNVDFNGNPAPTGFGLPANTYGAAAAQPGAWNPINFSAAAVPLQGLAGNATGVTLLADDGATFSFNNAGTTGNDEALMDDLFDIGGVGSGANVRVAGLAPGPYSVTTYAWAPDSATFRTTVTVPGAAKGGQPVGGAWAGHASGVTFAQHTLNVGAGGELNVNVMTTTGFGSLNGLQITQVPEPATLGLLALGGLALVRRRR